MAAFLIAAGLIAIVDGVVTLTTLGLVVLAIALSAIAYAQITGYIALANLITGQGPLVNSVSLQLSARQVAQLNTQFLPQRQLPDHSFPSHAFPSRQMPDRSAPNRGSPVKVINPPPPPIKSPPILPIKPAPQICPDGYTWNPVTERCEENPPPPVKRTPSQQVCPEGFEWDAATEQCVAIKPPPPPPNCPPGTTWDPQTETCKANPPPPPTPQPVYDPTQDEVEKCCSQSTYNAQLIQSQLNTIIDKLTELAAQPIGTGGIGDQCCTEIVAALGTSTQAIAAIATAIAGITPGAPTAVDLSAVVSALDSITGAIESKTAPPVDLSTIERELEGDTTIQAFIDQLVAEGMIAPDLAQLI